MKTKFAENRHWNAEAPFDRAGTAKFGSNFSEDHRYCERYEKCYPKAKLDFLPIAIEVSFPTLYKNPHAGASERIF